MLIFPIYFHYYASLQKQQSMEGQEQGQQHRKKHGHLLKTYHTTRQK
jgi:hypothetical protein